MEMNMILHGAPKKAWHSKSCFLLVLCNIQGANRLHKKKKFKIAMCRKIEMEVPFTTDTAQTI